jgi:hypothetical protein
VSDLTVADEEIVRSVFWEWAMQSSTHSQNNCGLNQLLSVPYETLSFIIYFILYFKEVINGIL